VSTVKPLIFVCPLFRKLHKLNKTEELKVTHIDIPVGIGCCVGIVWFEFIEIKGEIIILHAKSPSFRVATLKSFTCFINELV